LVSLRLRSPTVKGPRRDSHNHVTIALALPAQRLELGDYRGLEPDLDVAVLGARTLDAHVAWQRSGDRSIGLSGDRDGDHREIYGGERKITASHLRPLF